MDYSLDIDKLYLRMLGYYNKEGQSLNEEKEEIELANELARRLKVSFDNLKDVNNNEEFKEAKENGVFIFRDKYSNLYAYWHKEGIARITNVVYSNTEIKPLPPEYKNWFTPGKAITIEEINKDKKYLLNYLDYKVGKIISLKADFLGKPLFGKLDYVGKDFLSIKDKNSKTYYVGNHFCIEVHEEFSLVDIPEDANFELLDDNNKKLIPMGTFTNSSNNGSKYWFSIGGESFCSTKEDVLAQLQPGCGIVYTMKNKKLRSIHPAFSIAECLKLAQSLYNQDNKSSAAKDVIQHILENDPHNGDAKALLSEIETSQEAMLETTQKFKEAEELAKNPDTIRDAIDKFNYLLEQGKKIKDCITSILECHRILLNTCNNDEEADILRHDSYKFIQKNHKRLTANQSVNIRLRHFLGMGMIKEYLEIADQVLQDPLTDTKDRAKFLYLKACIYNKMDESSQKSKALSYARESIYLNPFNNKSELMLKYSIEYPTPTPTLENIPSDILNLIEYTNQYTLENRNIFDSKERLYLKDTLANAKQNDATAIVEYIAALAQNLSRKKEHLNSALYLWNRLFAMTGHFGYFIQHNLAIALSEILDVSINKDETMVSAPAWENKKNWKEIINCAQSISNEQLRRIAYVINCNNIVIEEIENYIARHSHIMDKIKVHVAVLDDKNIKLSKLYAKEYHEVEAEATEIICNSYKNKKSLSELYETLTKIDFYSSPFDKLKKADFELLKNLNEVCTGSINILIREVKPNRKIDLATEIDKKIQEIANTITASPTPLGTECILSCVQEIKNKLNIIKRSLPKPDISIKLDRRDLKKDNDGFYTISVTAYNAEGALSASNLTFKMGSDDIQKFDTPIPSLEVLEGGKDATLTFKFKPKPQIANKPCLEFTISCNYDDHKGIARFKAFKNQQVYLNDVQFIKIERNPYSNSIIFKHTDIAFAGRKEDIKSIIEKVLSGRASQIIVYGQKRCGKTTLVNAVESILTEKHDSNAFCINRSFIENNEAEFYFSILSAIQSKLDSIEGELNSFDIPPKKEFSEENSFELFCNSIKAFKKYMKDKGWENKKPILILDEFTLLFERIKEGKISKDILKRWKNIQENEQTCFATIFVGHDVIPGLFEEEYARNATAIIEKYPLTYLDEKAARELIEKPTELKNGSRFDEDAIKRILYYTARSPWFIQTFMEKMVGYINSNHIITVTDVDVDEVAKIILNKENDIFPSIRYFDHLINPGLPDKFCKIKEKDIEKTLRDISLNCKDTEWCNISTLYEDKMPNEKIDEILNDLDTRKVIERKENNTLLKIKVGLFKEWLTNN